MPEKQSTQHCLKIENLELTLKKSVQVTQLQNTQVTQSKNGQDFFRLSDINFTLQSGQLSVLAGRNGSGKTVLAKILAGLIAQNKGNIYFDDIDLIKEKTARALKIGLVLQASNLQTVGETVIDDLLFGPLNIGCTLREATARAQAALHKCGLQGQENSFVHQLSGGQLKRLAIASILALDPPCIILDEPFAGLDLSGVREIVTLILELKKNGHMLLVITHEIEKILGAADELLVMDAGRIVLKGEAKSVLTQGISNYGLRDPLRQTTDISQLLWH